MEVLSMDSVTAEAEANSRSLIRVEKSSTFLNTAVSSLTLPLALDRVFGEILRERLAVSSLSPSPWSDSVER
jgi:hypothetical protein